MYLTKKNSVLVPKQRLFAPMLGTFGGGSIRGFQPLGGGLKYYIREFGSDDTTHTHRGMAVDSNDNIIITGEGTPYSGGPAGEYGYIIQFAKDGTENWYRDISFSAGEYIKLRDVAVDSSDNIFFVGNANVGSGNNDNVIGKLTSNGTASSIKKYGSTSFTDEFTLAVALDANDNVYTVSNLDIPYNQTLRAKMGNNIGTFSYNNRMNLSGYASRANDIAINNQYNRVITIGYDESYMSGSKFSSYTLITDLNSNTTNQFVLRYGDSSRHTYGWVVASDNGTSNANSIYLGGQTDIGTTAGAAAWIAKLNFNSSGDISSSYPDWSRMIDGSPGTDRLDDIVVSSDNSSIYGVFATNTGTLGSNQRTGIIKYDDSGTLQWVRIFSTAASSNDASVALNSEGDLVIASSYTNSSANNKKQGFYMVYPSDGSITGTFGNYHIQDGSSYYSISATLPTKNNHSISWQGAGYSLQNLNSSYNTSSRLTNEVTEPIA